MSVKDSRARPMNKKKFDDNFDEIFRKGKKRENTHVEVEDRVKSDLYGKVKRYHFKPTDKTIKGEAPAQSFRKGTAEITVSNL